MQLYTSTNGTNPQRVRIYLAEKGIELPKVELDLLAGDQTKPDYLKVNSLGTVPALKLDSGEVITESVAICRYLEELHPSPPLFGNNHIERARVEMWNRRVELEIYANAAWAVRHSHPFFKGKINQIADFATQQCEKTAARVAWLDQEMADGRAHLAGENFSIADITGYVAMSKLFPAIELAVPADLKHVTAWLARICERRSITAFAAG